jgi:hypothetical protein
VRAKAQKNKEKYLKGQHKFRGMTLMFITQFLGWVNVFISLFIIIFAFVFFKRTEPHDDRKPWLFLFFSVIVFFVIELSGVIPRTAALTDYRNFMKTVFIAIVLYVFVFQYNLLNKADEIIINKKGTPRRGPSPKSEAVQAPEEKLPVKKKSR